MISRKPSGARVFAAVELPDLLRRALAGVVEQLDAAAPRGSVRWVRPEAIHITLQFYGEVKADLLPELRAALEQAAAGSAPLRLDIGELGAFPNRARPRVIWAGVGGDVDGLRVLQEAVQTASAALGFEPEKRDYTPHLTLGRVNSNLRPAARQALAGVLGETRAERVGEFTADTLSLMRSQLKPGGAVYTPLFTAPLGGRNS